MEQFLSNIYLTPAKPPCFLMTLECLPAVRLPAPRTSLTPPRTKLSFVSILWVNPLVMTLSQLSSARADSGPKLYVPLRRIHPQKQTHIQQTFPSCWDGKVRSLFDVPRHALTFALHRILIPRITRPTLPSRPTEIVRTLHIP